MKLISIKKSILGPLFLAYALIPNPSRAIGIATGPSLGIAGFYSSFDTSASSKKIDTKNLALQVGWFAKLDLWLLYAKLAPCFVLDWHKLPNQLNRAHFRYITVPFTIGMPFLGWLRPHIGLIFRIPLNSLDDTKLQGNNLIANYSKKINGYIVGIGIDLANVLIDICWQFAWSAIDRKSISNDLLYGLKKHRPKQLALKVSYNLLG
ncbi:MULTISPECIES: hypothetical protein [Candidatus Cardinium]|uniref:hypothetical protein n=1 Tax=Candidatus Cardinium TaxID=273135 RepID=UPI001FAAC9BC|nr:MULTISPECIES: hypothetical protein [Cardinium]